MKCWLILRRGRDVSIRFKGPRLYIPLESSEQGVNAAGPPVANFQRRRMKNLIKIGAFENTDPSLR